ncbi:OmpH family outer membrane protein [Pelagerythrobacter rhizovicinus]|uniref:OmpH family outer membrane protein n=1 Tax=Pelagerythrobacter rhizovicinus TaxID=2268576 RepID=A0A4Q2KP05_9SPHN|nr:OmpH family outer membrane protein [Pelagerythrobacter rhizovicinus]RXZ66309.1 OmpH family outer membrane protein [Pelagerythrobacter rhizovicinus]
MIRRSVASFVLLIGAATAAPAQTVNEPTPAVQPLGGPVVPGVCLLSREAMFANAAVGKAATARLQELAQTAQAEIDAERTQVETEARALEGQPDNAETRQRREELARRWQALQERAAHSSREIAATRAKALERIASEAQPVIAEVYGEKGCGLILDRNSALGGNFANDLTPDVVRRLDARIQTITFERERLPQQQASPANTPAS